MTLDKLKNSLKSLFFYLGITIVCLSLFPAATVLLSHQLQETLSSSQPDTTFSQPLDQLLRQMPVTVLTQSLPQGYRVETAEGNIQFVPPTQLLAALLLSETEALPENWEQQPSACMAVLMRAIGLHSALLGMIGDQTEGISGEKLNDICWLTTDQYEKIAQPLQDSQLSPTELEKNAEESRFNKYINDNGKAERGIIACGIAWNYLNEYLASDSTLPRIKISQYPLPKKLICDLASKCKEILVIEEGQPFVEEQIKGILPSECKISGKLSGLLPRTGELTPDAVAAALGVTVEQPYGKSEIVVPRPPALCQGCGHRDVYNALNEIIKEFPGAKVFGDIGCYTLGALPPFRAIDSCVDMGASITMAKGAADAGLFPAIAIIGDSTFTHSGMTGLLDAVNCNSPITVIISDNLTTAMTGGQDSAGTNKFEAICKGIGVHPEHLRVVVPLAKNMEEIKQILREEINYKGTSVIIPRRECIQTFNRKRRKEKKS